MSPQRMPAGRTGVGAFVVTAGIGVKRRARRDHDDYNSIMVKALADRLAEAFAEWLHKQVRAEWGYGKAESPTNEDINPRALPSIRPAPGYPACPDHTEKTNPVRPAAGGITIGRDPDRVLRHVAGSRRERPYFAHPQARYFAVGKSTATRSRTTPSGRSFPGERWSGGWRRNLNYDA
ncbi:MAG: hypothetical protein MRJ92_04635 [Nitrospira sp.]|nr:hypothetical protein [Nitrospira sp.]